MVISEFIHTEMTDTNMINDSYERSSQRIYALLRLRRGVWPADWLKLQLIIAIWCVALAADGATGQEISSCCDKATGSCRTVCEKMSLVEIASDPILREDRVSNIYKFCPSELTEFWVCMNDTLQVQTQSDACYDACAAALRDGGGGSRSRALSACADSSPALVHCLRNLTRSTTTTDPAKYLPCCNQSGKPACRESCNRVLRTQTASQDIVDSLQEGGCGLPLPYDAMWQCFLRKDSQADSANNAGNYDRLGIDSAKLHCCQKGTTAHCKKMCFNTFTKDWIDYWERFEAECLKQPTEVNMAMCIDEVEEPCELGCDGLSYCTNFNNRPTELFRSCNARADTAAHYDVATWQTQGYLGLPGLRLPVRNISNCSPNIWKAVACTLQIKPCARQDHFSQICREDCFQLLSQCLDWSRVSGDFTAASLCGKLSNDDEESPCVSLRNFLDPSAQAFTEPQDQVTFPCKGNTCNNSQVCVVNRNCKSASDGCSRYNCQNACALGEASQYMVPSGTYVRIPISNLQRGCLKICQCSVSGNIEKCQPLPCFSYDSCTLPNDKVEHGAQFYMECNLCTCFAGELLCSRRVCEGDGTTSGVITRLPCNCPPHHLPVCGANGNTYPSSCLAKCAGLSDADIEFGACSARDPCVGVTCAEENSMCMPTRTVCLSSMHKPCPQHVCVNTSGCNAQATSPVCDTEGTTHPNPCYLFTSGKQLAYEGECLKGCSKSGQVCGGDGNTYKSECAAWANLINIDYEGPCLAVGPISDKMERKCNLDHISCPPLQKEDCIGFTAPGSCCPRCGGALRILYSKKQIDRALYAIRGHSQISITLRSVLLALQRHVQVAECKVRGHLTIEMDIFVMIGTSVPHPSDLQLNSCQREAEKLSSMIRRQSARIISELNLSALSYAIDVHTFLTNSASLDCDRNFALMVSLVFICVRHLVHLFDS